ncbi:ABC transporter ATP-binding protein [Romboutsia maritimum]|uniref:ABC transporter ATP-binding protein n=1 Tax=Romboutsia maritimum TaxID=2020948 RepID=A0A371IRQ1_9FIRM|nr:ABC transporter ATP-binding protein [Romboutsia maritimum]RDY23160.1 ABC transporter ATP-binding protein [Romboutsia maritimum]
MIEVDSLGFGYNQDKKILEDIKFDLNSGQCLAILGNNGAGKSTMLKCLNKIINPKCGSVYIDKEDVLKFKQSQIAKKMAYVAQKNESNRFTVFDAVLLGRKPYIKVAPTEKDIEIVKDIIERMNLKPYSLRYLDELSGGELQKVMLARALAQQPKVLLLDEPTSNLDLKNQLDVLKLVQQIARDEDISVIIVIHDLNLALRYCDRFLFLKDKKVYAYGGLEVVSSENIEYVYNVCVDVKDYGGNKFIIPAV